MKNLKYISQLMIRMSYGLIVTGLVVLLVSAPVTFYGVYQGFEGRDYFDMGMQGWMLGLLIMWLGGFLMINLIYRDNFLRRRNGDTHFQKMLSMGKTLRYSLTEDYSQAQFSVALYFSLAMLSLCALLFISFRNLIM